MGNIFFSFATKLFRLIGRVVEIDELLDKALKDKEIISDQS
jgi:hypothetical protein